MVHDAFVNLFTNISTIATVLSKKLPSKKTAKNYFERKTALLKKPQFKIIIFHSKLLFASNTMREKCPNTEFFLVRIFPHSDWIGTKVFSLNTGKYGPEKTPHLDTFHTVIKMGKDLSPTKRKSTQSIFNMICANHIR